MLEKDFKKQDEHAKGTVTLFQLKKIMNGSNLVTPKEVNALVRNIQVEDYNYSTFKQDLFNVRFELAKSRILESNLDHVQKSLVEACKQYDAKSNGKIHITQMREILRNSKFVALSPFQIHMLLGQAVLDEKRFVNYQNFVIRVKEMIESVFTVEAINDTAEMILSKTVDKEDIEHTYISNLDLFKIFKVYDKNQNGYLELDEYIECLKDQQLNLTGEEVITMSLSADTNGDGQIDYEEFMKHFRDILDLTRFQQIINDKEHEHMAIVKTERLEKQRVEEEKKQQDDLLA
jgi:Ca2+-binding EF-hand superfamily protein